MEAIERQNYKVHFRSYSENVYGVRVIINNEHHYIINDILKGDMAIETLYRLIDYSNEYSDYGFISIEKDFKLFIEPDYKFNYEKCRFVYKTSNKVVDFNKYKYNIEHGIELYKNRWK